MSILCRASDCLAQFQSLAGFSCSMRIRRSLRFVAMSARVRIGAVASRGGGAVRVGGRRMRILRRCLPGLFRTLLFRCGFDGFLCRRLRCLGFRRRLRLSSGLVGRLALGLRRSARRRCCVRCAMVVMLGISRHQ